jgi:hypothetical protein
MRRRVMAHFDMKDLLGGIIYVDFGESRGLWP